MLHNELSGYQRLQWPWWRHQMETFSALLVICAGNSLVTGQFPAQRPVTRSFDVFFDLRLNNNREPGDLRRHRVHYDVTEMYSATALTCSFQKTGKIISPILFHQRSLI